MKPTLLVAAILFCSVTSFGQEPPGPQGPPMQPPPQRFGGDPIRQLNLSVEQQNQIRTIREKGRDERAEITRQLAEANRLLQEALEAEAPDENVLEQRVKAVATAQAALMRMRILTEVRVRKVLTQEQRVILRNLQQQAAQERRRDRRIDRDERLERREQRRNTLGPIGPRRNPPPTPPQP